MSGKKVDLAADIRAGLTEALDYFKGDETKARVRRVKKPRFKEAPEVGPQEIKRFRLKHDLNQAQLADLLLVSLDTVKKWEIGENFPQRSTQRLLQILSLKPDLLSSLLEDEENGARGA